MSTERAAVARSLCAALLREMAGFRGYPTQGEDRFVNVLQEISVSVDHARAIVFSFEEHFPTVRELRDVAMNLRSQFQPPEDQRAKWEEEYGKPEPVQIDSDARPARDIDRLWKQIMNRDEFKGRDGRAKLQGTSWTKLAGIARELGFEGLARAWESSERHGG